MTSKQRWSRVYDIFIVILALFSIFLVVLDYLNLVNLDAGVWLMVDNVILIIFTIDYFSRLYLAKDKWVFFKAHLFDLLAILPFNAAFNFFRISRVFRIARLGQVTRLLRLIGFTGKTQAGFKRLLKTNGLIYLFWVSFIFLLIAATVYSFSEHIGWGNSLWWAITTASTVGYGDISPHTLAGRVAAAILMLVGISIIGMLTSALTAFFSRNDQTNRRDEALQILRQIQTQLDAQDTPKLIREYKALMDEGIITAAEFEAKKSALLKLSSEPDNRPTA